MLLKILLLMVGQVVAATAVIAIKASTLHPVLLAAVRLLIAATVLTPLYLRDSRIENRDRAAMFAAIKPSILPGLFLALHFVSWNYGARATIAANANLIVNLVPIAMPFLVYGMTRELITRREVVGTLLAIAGVAVLTGADIHVGKSTLPGDLTCFLSMIFLSAYIALARRNNRQPTVWLYVVPLYWFAGLLSLGAAAVIMSSASSVSGAAVQAVRELTPVNIALAVYLGLFPTIIGHTIINRSMGVLPSQIVSLSMLTQFIFAGLFAFILFGEIPTPLLAPAAALVIAGAALVIFKKQLAAESPDS